MDAASRICRWWKKYRIVAQRKRITHAICAQAARSSAAAIVQAFWRSKLSRLWFVRQQCALRLLQRVIRGGYVRRTLRPKSECDFISRNFSLSKLETQQSFVPVGYRAPSSTAEFQRRSELLQAAVRLRCATRVGKWWKAVVHRRRVERHLWRLQRLAFLNSRAIIIQRWFRACRTSRKIDRRGIDEKSWNLVSTAGRIAACGARHNQLRQIWLEASGKRNGPQLPPLPRVSRRGSAPSFRSPTVSTRVLSSTSRLNQEFCVAGRYAAYEYSGRQPWNDSPHLTQLSWCAAPHPMAAATPPV